MLSDLSANKLFPGHQVSLTWQVRSDATVGVPSFPNSGQGHGSRPALVRGCSTLGQYGGTATKT